MSFSPLTREQAGVDQIINIDDKVMAVLIDSTFLGAPVWFAFDESFDPGDGVPVFYSDELRWRKDKPVSMLRKLYETKKTFGLGSRVRQ